MAARPDRGVAAAAPCSDDMERTGDPCSGAMRYASARILIFAKAPIPGQVKTRLIPALGAAGAAELASELLDGWSVVSRGATRTAGSLVCAGSRSSALSSPRRVGGGGASCPAWRGSRRTTRVGGGGCLDPRECSASCRGGYSGAGRCLLRPCPGGARECRDRDWTGRGRRLRAAWAQDPCARLIPAYALGQRRRRKDHAAAHRRGWDGAAPCCPRCGTWIGPRICCAIAGSMRSRPAGSAAQGSGRDTARGWGDAY